MRVWKRFYRISLLVPALLLLPVWAGATPMPTVVIAEIQTGSAASASEEFIELANTSDQAVNVSEWRVEYFSSSAADFSKPYRSFVLRGVLPAGERYLLASNNYLSVSANDSFSPTLSGTSGVVRLMQNNTQADVIAWGKVAAKDVAAIPSPESGKSLQRKTDGSGKLIYTGDNLADFEQTEPNPQGTLLLGEPLDESQTAPIPTVQVTADGTTGEVASLSTVATPAVQPQITELLPNPASPATDADDEFVELYNPSGDALDLEGYKLQTGTTYSHSYTFKADDTITGSSYKAFYVSQTNATLANSGGKARLVSPAGQVVSETLAYGTADDGEAWAWNGSSWEWTTTPTPNATNIFTTPASAAAKSNSNKSSTKKAATSKSTAKIAGAKTSGGKNAKNGSGAGSSNSEPQEQGGARLHPWILAGVGGAAILYGVYEYRQDLANAFYRIRRFRRAG